MTIIQLGVPRLPNSDKPQPWPQRPEVESRLVARSHGSCSHNRAANPYSISIVIKTRQSGSLLRHPIHFERTSVVKTCYIEATVIQRLNLSDHPSSSILCSHGGTPLEWMRQDKVTLCCLRKLTAHVAQTCASSSVSYMCPSCSK